VKWPRGNAWLDLSSFPAILASYTHTFFHVKELVVNTFDNEQGLIQAETNELGKLVLDLAERYRRRAG
jgi:hypothetical protein